MSRLVVILALAFPLGAHANFVHLEYEGVVRSVSRTVCACDPTQGYAPDHPEFTGYTVGDRVHGFLAIDLTKVPPDRRPLEPAVGIYQALANSGGYISGNGAPRFHLVVNDSVSVRDTTADSPFEHYIVTDQWRLPNGHGQMNVFMATRRTGLDLVTGESIAQTIDARPSSDLELTGYIQKFVKSVKGSVNVFASLLLSRVKVTPGRCRP